MRLAIVRQRYDPAGPTERGVEPVLEALLERNVAISLVAREAPLTRLQLVETAVCNPFHVGSLWRDAGFARAACRAVRRIRPTLVEAHAPLLCCDVYRAFEGVQASRLEARRRAHAASGRSPPIALPAERWQLATEKRMFAAPWLRAAICASTMVRDDVHLRFGLPASRLHVVADPVDGAVFHPGVAAERDAVRARCGIAAGAVMFVAIASDFALGGIATAIDALALLPSRAQLVVVGEDPDAGAFRERARARGVAGRVSFAGAQADARPWYGCADAFVLPSFYDPSGSSAHEAMACGVPVVASTRSGAAQRVCEHDAGVAFEAGDVAALAARLDALMDATTRARCAANARRAVAGLGPDAITLQLVLLYRDLLADGMRASTLGAGTATGAG